MLHCLKNVKFHFLLNNRYFFIFNFQSVLDQHSLSYPYFWIVLKLKYQIFLIVELQHVYILLNMILFYMMLNIIFWKTHVFSFMVSWNEWDRMKEFKDFFANLLCWKNYTGEFILYIEIYLRICAIFHRRWIKMISLNSYFIIIWLVIKITPIIF